MVCQTEAPLGPERVGMGHVGSPPGGWLGGCLQPELRLLRVPGRPTAHSGVNCRDTVCLGPPGAAAAHRIPR